MRVHWKTILNCQMQLALKRAVCFMCACWLANRGLSLKSQWKVNTRRSFGQISVSCRSHSVLRSFSVHAFSTGLPHAYKHLANHGLSLKSQWNVLRSSTVPVFSTCLPRAYKHLYNVCSPQVARYSRTSTWPPRSMASNFSFLTQRAWVKSACGLKWSVNCNLYQQTEYFALVGQGNCLVIFNVHVSGLMGGRKVSWWVIR